MSSVKRKWTCSTFLSALLHAAALLAFSLIAAAAPSSNSGENQKVFFVDDVACRWRATQYVAGHIEDGKFISLRSKLRTLREHLSELVGGSPAELQQIREEYRTLRQKKMAYDRVCSGGARPARARTSAARLTFQSDSFPNGGDISVENTCWANGSPELGDGTSPALRWKNIPWGASRLALLLYDESEGDALHWFMLIDRRSPWFRAGVPESIAAEEGNDIPNIVQNQNDFGAAGYSGPCPPADETHRYKFELFALRRGARGSYFGSDVATIKKQLQKYAIARGSLVGSFTARTRPGRPTPTPTFGRTPSVTPSPVPTRVSRVTPVPTSTPYVFTPTPYATVAPTPSNPGRVIGVAGGLGHYCELYSSGGVKCRGINDYGQLGDGTTTSRFTLEYVSGLTSGVSSIMGGWFHTCALLNSGAVKCWGYNLTGELGDGTWNNIRTTPVVVSGLSSGVQQVVTAAGPSCALLNSGGVKCWGFSINVLTPVYAVGLTSGASQLEVTGIQFCARLYGGGRRCWTAWDLMYP